MVFAGTICVNAEEGNNVLNENDLYARSAVLMDAESGRILYSKNGNEQMPMASTTKIMTCIIALENAGFDDVVTVSEYAASMPDVQLNIKANENYYLGDLLYSLMLESHNDTAVAIAEHVSGSVEEFAKLMNAKAAQIGCKSTYFITPNGLDQSDEKGKHSTTASDLALIMSYCINKSPMRDKFLEITRTQNYSLTNKVVDENGNIRNGSRNFSCYNRNLFLNMMEGALTGKTGFTADAGYCYVGALRRDERTFIVALLACGWPNHKGYKWSDTKKLMEYGLSNYEYRNVWQELPKQEIVVKDSGNDQNIYQKNSVAEVEIQQKPEVLKVLLRTDENVEISVQMEKALSAPVEKGQKVGEVRYIIDKNIIGKYDVLTRSGLKKRTFFWCLKRCMERFFCYTRLNTFFVDLR